MLWLSTTITRRLLTRQDLSTRALSRRSISLASLARLAFFARGGRKVRFDGIIVRNAPRRTETTYITLAESWELRAASCELPARDSRIVHHLIGESIVSRDQVMVGIVVSPMLNLGFSFALTTFLLPLLLIAYVGNYLYSECIFERKLKIRPLDDNLHARINLRALSYFSPSNSLE